jgi:hypothetical protein
LSCTSTSFGSLLQPSYRDKGLSVNISRFPCKSLWLVTLRLCSVIKWFSKCELQIYRSPKDTFWDIVRSYYFSTSTKGLFVIFTVLMSALMVQNQWWVKQLAL